MDSTMASLRENPPSVIAGTEVVKVCDYGVSVATDLISGEKTVIKLPKSDVLAYSLSGGAEVVVRPSGTEPKIKIYLTAIGESKCAATELMAKLESAAKPLLGI